MPGERTVVIVGSGAAGTAAARTLASAGVRVTVVENDRLGGTCLWYGCMPKKALYNAAVAYADMRKADEFGAGCVAPDLDWEGVLAWKWHAQESYAGDQEALFASRGIEVVRGTAVFEAPMKLRVGERVLEPDAIVLANGAAPSIPPIDGAELADTSTEALHYGAPPASLAIVGGGYIAFEFAGIYASFGSRVTMLVRGDTLLRGWDPEIVAVARRRLEAMGVTFRLDTPTTGVAPAERGYTVSIGDGETLAADRVLLATGRHSRVAELDPQRGGIGLDDRGRPVLDALGRTSDARVWIAGDARGRAMHTPLANAEGHHTARAILGEVNEPLDTSAVTEAVFTFPQVAKVGLTEAQAQAGGIPYRVHRQPFESLGAAIVSDDRDGLVKLLSAEDGRILGAQVAAPDAADLVYALGTAIKGGLRLADVSDVLPVHPAYAQALQWAAG